MKSIPWYYVYSPKYEIFHHILRSSIGPTNDFIINPVFVPQEAFSNTYSMSGDHFFSGNTVKVDCIVKALKNHPGEHILVTDVDVIADNISEFRIYLESYLHNDITFMADKPIEKTINLGFAFIKSTPDTIALFETAVQQIKSTGGLDQPIVRELLPSFEGQHDVFSLPEVSPSNLYRVGSKCYIIQTLCSNAETYEKNLFEKLASVVKILDITDLLHLIPDDVLETLRWYFRQNYPDHYISKL
jgi:hypothetical protein